jgi:hypothetical protein
MERKRLLRRPLVIRDILAWASAHREVTGQWPTRSSGGIMAAKFETWASVDIALRRGCRELPGGSSLAQLLAEHYGVRNVQNLPPLSEQQILDWADEHHERTGSWPNRKSGRVQAAPREKWPSIDMALGAGCRDLPGDSSLPKLLAEHRGARNRKALAPLSEEQILQWADAFQELTGRWPSSKSGPIAEAPGETWLAVTMALRKGLRGLPGGSSLALLLADQRGVRNCWTLPNLSIPQILAWADAFHSNTGNWPRSESGPLAEAPGETWTAVNQALKNGFRGLPGGSSLAKLLAAERGVRNHSSVPELSRRQILDWADAHKARTGDWPKKESGPIPESPGDTWWAVDAALYLGNRGLRPGSTLARLLSRHRGRRHHLELPRLSMKKILAWADKHHERTGRWPNINSGALVDAPQERWRALDDALRQGNRGLSGGSSLLQCSSRSVACQTRSIGQR